MDNLISAKKTAEVLGCSERHVYNLIKRGKLQAFKDGITRIYISSLERYLERHTEKSK